MLSKLKKLLIIVVIVGGIGYLGYKVFIVPGGFTDKEELINSYFESFLYESSCAEHFNSETEAFCLDFQDLIGNDTLVVSSLIKNGDDYRAILLIDGVEMGFNITFIEIEVSGLKSFMNSTYYKIDTLT